MKINILFAFMCFISFMPMKGQTIIEDNTCLFMKVADDIENGSINPDSVMVDTCKSSPTYQHLFAKRRWTTDFNTNIFNGPLAPRGTILTRNDINSDAFATTAAEFKQIEDNFGEFWFERATDTLVGDSTTPFFTLYFQKYVDIENVTSQVSAIKEVKSIGFRHYPTGLVSFKGNNTLSPAVNIYPNPASENISITFSKNNSFKTTNCALRDITGREIFLKEIPTENSDYNFSLKEIPVGVYMLEVRSGSEFFTKKISVIR